MIKIKIKIGIKSAIKQFKKAMLEIIQECQESGFFDKLNESIRLNAEFIINQKRKKEEKISESVSSTTETRK